MIEQKLIRVQDDNFYKVEQYLDEGWEVSKISACSSGQCINTYLYVLLYRNKNYKEYKDIICD